MADAKEDLQTRVCKMKLGIVDPSDCGAAANWAAQLYRRIKKAGLLTRDEKVKLFGKTPDLTVALVSLINSTITTRAVTIAAENAHLVDRIVLQ